MRIVVVLAIISSYLTTSIFTPTYLPKKETDFAQILIEIAEKNSSKEQFLRGLMLSTIDDLMRADLRSKRSESVEEIVKLIEGLVGSRTAAVFAKEMRKMVDRASEIWQTFETRFSHFEVAQEGLHSWEWKSLQLDSTRVYLAERTVNETDFHTDDKLLVVFPRVYTVDGATDIPVFPGVVLQKTQTAAARQETIKIEASEESQGRVGARRVLTSPRMVQGGFPAPPGAFLG